MMTKELMFLLPTLSVSRLSGGEVAVFGWLAAWENDLIELLDCNCPLSTNVQCPTATAPTN